MRPTAMEWTQAQEHAAFLKTTPLFSRLEAPELRDVVHAAQVLRITGKHCFFRQGESARTLFIIEDGRIKLSQLTAEGHQVALQFLGPGEMFGGISVLTGVSYPATAQAVTDASLFAWPDHLVLKLARRTPQIAFNALELVAQRVRDLQNRLRELTTERVEKRIARALLRLTVQTGKRVAAGMLLDLPLSRQDLAELAGTTLYTVSRTLSGWEQQGIVSTGRERVVVREVQGLVAIVEDRPRPAGKDSSQTAP